VILLSDERYFLVKCLTSRLAQLEQDKMAPIAPEDEILMLSSVEFPVQGVSASGTLYPHKLVISHGSLVHVDQGADRVFSVHPYADVAHLNEHDEVLTLQYANDNAYNFVPLPKDVPKIVFLIRAHMALPSLLSKLPSHAFDSDGSIGTESGSSFPSRQDSSAYMHSQTPLSSTRGGDTSFDSSSAAFAHSQALALRDYTAQGMGESSTKYSDSLVEDSSTTKDETSTSYQHPSAVHSRQNSTNLSAGGDDPREEEEQGRQDGPDIADVLRAMQSGCFMYQILKGGKGGKTSKIWMKIEARSLVVQWGEKQNKLSHAQQFTQLLGGLRPEIAERLTASNKLSPLMRSASFALVLGSGDVLQVFADTDWTADIWMKGIRYLLDDNAMLSAGAAPAATLTGSLAQPGSTHRSRTQSMVSEVSHRSTDLRQVNTGTVLFMHTKLGKGKDKKIYARLDPESMYLQWGEQPQKMGNSFYVVGVHNIIRPEVEKNISKKKRTHAVVEWALTFEGEHETFLDCYAPSEQDFSIWMNGLGDLAEAQEYDDHTSGPIVEGKSGGDGGEGDEPQNYADLLAQIQAHDSQRLE
jgi:hypothetical protein